MPKEIIVYVGQHTGRRMGITQYWLSSQRGLLESEQDYCSQYDDRGDPTPVEDADMALVLDDEATLGDAIEAARLEILQQVAHNAPADAISAKARGAINAIAAKDAAYWDKTLASRLEGAGKGSETTHTNASALQVALLDANWVEFDHPALAAGSLAFKTEDVQGHVGVVPIMPLDWIVLRDEKGTGKVSAFFKRRNVSNRSPFDHQKEWSPYTVLVCGVEEGELVAFTFHPGDPIRASEAPAEGNEGRTIQGFEALEMGLTYAKV